MAASRGIYNRGTTCYFNAFTQNAFHAGDFREDILLHTCDSADCKASILRTLFESLQTSGTSPVHVDENMLRQIAHTLTEEGDCLELFSFWNDSHLGALILKHFGQEVHKEVSPLILCNIFLL
jgi:hypothetical protein